MSANDHIGRQELVSRLREYLSELNSESHRTLARSIDRSRTRGEQSPVHAIIMDALREMPDTAASNLPRIPSAERAFFLPLDPIIASTPLPDKQVGIVDRNSLRPIWIWIARDLTPGRCDNELAALRTAVVDEEPKKILRCAEELQRVVCQEATEYIDDLDRTEGSLQILEAQLGSQRILADLHDVIGFLDQQDIFKSFLARLPARLPVGNAGLDILEDALIAYKDYPKAKAIYGFAGIIDRLGSASDLVRFAILHARSSDPAIIRRTAASGAVQVALSEAMLYVENLRLMLSGDRNVDHIVSIMRQYHELISSFTRILDDVPNDPWLRRIVTVRAQATALLTKELDPLLHLIKRSVSVMEADRKEIVPDKSTVEDAVFGLTLFMVTREIRDSLAINSVIDRLSREITDVLESQGKQAIDRLSVTSEENWEAGVARSAAAVDLFRLFFGDTYGGSLARRHAATVEGRSLDRAG